MLLLIHGNEAHQQNIEEIKRQHRMSRQAMLAKIIKEI